MTKWHDVAQKTGILPLWPYPIQFDKQQEIETDVLVIGGGISGCWAAISAARSGLKVALVEKGDTIRSGAGGPGCDHWCNAPANPHSKVDPDEWARKITEKPDFMKPLMTGKPGDSYVNGIGNQIQCREDYDTLLEMEHMGGKIRDSKDEYLGAEGRYDDTKIMISPRASANHSTEVTIRIWGTTFKPVLKKECQRLGVKIFDRVMVTSLLNEGGIQGARIVGATGLNNRTGEFIIFKSKSTVLATAGNWSLYLLNTELAGYNMFRSRTVCGDGAAMAFRAGVELTLMERTGALGLGSGFHHTWYGGAGDASYENIQIVDSNGKKLPWPVQGWKDGGAMRPSPQEMEKIMQDVRKGIYSLPFWGDFPAMPDVERRATWKLMLGEESTVRNITRSYEAAGFNPEKHLLMNYTAIEGAHPTHLRTDDGGGGPVVDWDLKSSVDGLYIAGEQMFAPGDHSFAASTGRYAGRKAAAYAGQTAQANVSGEQIAQEKVRIYAPLGRSQGIEWKELHAGVSRAMQMFCGDYKTESILNIGLGSLKEIEDDFVPRLYALDPHKLMRSIEDLSLLTYAQIVVQASLARKASSQPLGFNRMDFPEVDPPAWNKFLTIKQANGKVQTGELPLSYWGNMKANYEAHNRDYRGVHKRK